MPIFEYECEMCGHTFEKLVFGKDSKKIECPACKSKKSRKLISTVSVGNSTSSGCGPSKPGGFS